MRRNTIRRAGLRLLLPLLLAGFSLSAGAVTLQEVQALVRQGQYSQALDQVDRLLASSPKDRSARFLKGVILTEMNRLDDAVAVFSALSQEAPELPEPHNNLAVIYAQQKQYDKARAELELAIRTHPAYAIAHENLGDLYTKLARQAYDRALQIDGSNQNAQTKLNLIRDIISVGAKSGPVAKPATQVAAVSPAPAPAPSQAPAGAAKPAAPAVTHAPPASAASKPIAPVVASTPVEKPKTDKPVLAANPEDAVRKAVQAWATAWSRKDVKDYLGAYARDFQVPGGKNRSAWEKERAERVGKPGSISVTLSEVRVEMNGENKATVRFRQGYRSDNLDTTSGKTLVMVRQQGQWFIQQEKIGR